MIHLDTPQSLSNACQTLFTIGHIKDVVRFLKDNGFTLNHTRGSHYYFTAVINKVLRHVSVPYHSSLAIKPRTMKSIIEQSGIAQDLWLNKKGKKQKI